MIASTIALILSNYFVTLTVIGAICATVSLWRRHQWANRAAVLEAFLSYYCLFGIGLSFIYNFVIHVFFAKMAAHFIGWPNSPFQYEVGFASLGFGVVGLLAFRRDFGLRLAAVIGPAFFMWGAAAGHVYQMVVHHNFAPGNAGFIFWTDVLLPVLGIALLAGWRRTNR